MIKIKKTLFTALRLLMHDFFPIFAILLIQAFKSVGEFRVEDMFT
jgi:hypothetical protein